MSQDITLQNDIVKIDSHQHFWLLERGDYSWLTPELATLYKDYLPKDLAAELAKANVKATVVVQASNTEAETKYLLDLAEKTDFIAGVVGWVDMENEAALSSLKAFSQSQYFKGIRPMLQDIDDVNWILQKEFEPIFEFLEANNLCFDALVREHHLANIHLLAQKYPTLKIVINHLAKPNVDKPPSTYWNIQMESFITLENVSIKLSGLMTEASTGQVAPEQLFSYLKEIMSVFGASRIMWGSDWPVLNLNGDYETWVSLTDALLQHCSAEEKHAIWAENARSFYNLSAQL